MKRTAWILLVLLVAACGSRPPAPVLERSGQTGSDHRVQSLTEEGQYRVRRGDTLHAIAFRFDLDFRELARWNGIRSPYTIFPGQLLHMSMPAGQGSVEPSPVERPASTRPATRPAPSPDPAPSPAQAADRPVRSTAERPPAVAAEAAGADPSRWQWPLKGRILRGFSPTDPARDGLDIAGREGQDVIATAGGTVVYSGNGLIGYGELIIIKHSERMLSAYGHNRVRLVQEGDRIRAGQKIAEVGRNDRNEQVLHFEIRVNGRPVNPLNYLPKI